MTELPPLPQYWEIRECKDYPGRCYFYNTVTRESTWIRPDTLEPRQIYVSQILLKTEKSVNPNTKDGPVTRTVDEAIQQMNDIRAQIELDKSIFPTIADEESDVDDKSSGGILGWIRKTDVPEEFAKAAWGLKPNEISEVIQSPLGIHLIWRQQ